jgi:hypothetical protein
MFQCAFGLLLLASSAWGQQTGSIGPAKPRRDIQFQGVSIASLRGPELSSGEVVAYVADDGTEVRSSVETYTSAMAATEQIENLVQLATRLFERTPRLDNNGKTVGSHVVLEATWYSVQVGVIAWNEDTQVHVIQSESLDHALAFEAEFYGADMLHSLREAATAFLVMVERGDPKQLARLSSKQGVVLGHISEPAIPLATIDKAIAEKRGMFCAFFDTTCIPRVSRTEPAQVRSNTDVRAPRSYRERFLSASSRDVEVHVSNGTVGSAIVTLHDNTQPGSAVLEFDFRLEDGEWKFAGVPLYTVHFPSLR